MASTNIRFRALPLDGAFRTKPWVGSPLSGHHSRASGCRAAGLQLTQQGRGISVERCVGMA